MGTHPRKKSTPSLETNPTFQRCDVVQIVTGMNFACFSQISSSTQPFLFVSVCWYLVVFFSDHTQLPRVTNHDYIEVEL